MGAPISRPYRLELPRDLLDLLGGELLLGDEPLELDGVDPAALLGAFHDRLQLLGLEQFDELVLRQAGVSVLSQARRSTISLTLRTIVRSFHGIRTANRVTNEQRMRQMPYSDAGRRVLHGGDVIRPVPDMIRRPKDTRVSGVFSSVGAPSRGLSRVAPRGARARARRSGPRRPRPDADSRSSRRR